MSISLLTSTCSALCGRNVSIDPHQRNTHVISTWYDSENVLRCTLLTPEVVTMAISVPKNLTLECNIGLRELVGELNNATPCTIIPHSQKTRISGRMSPYLMEYVGFADGVATHANLTGTRLLFYSCSTTTSRTYCTNSSSLAILSSWTDSDTAMVYSSRSNCYKLTTSGNVESKDANKHTCIIISHDGHIRIQGAPSDMPRVCSALHNTILRMSRSSSWVAFLSSLTVMSEVIF